MLLSWILRLWGRACVRSTGASCFDSMTLWTSSKSCAVTRTIASDWPCDEIRVRVRVRVWISWMTSAVSGAEVGINTLYYCEEEHLQRRTGLPCLLGSGSSLSSETGRPAA